MDLANKMHAIFYTQVYNFFDKVNIQISRRYKLYLTYQVPTQRKLNIEDAHNRLKTKEEEQINKNHATG
jgi:hypothetical protein